MKEYFLLFSLVFLLACSSTKEISSVKAVEKIKENVTSESENYVIRVGDRIDLVVWGYPEFNAQVHVKENGFISLPLIGEILTAGLTKNQLKEILKEKLSVYISGEIKINIDITSIMVQKVTVFGAVIRQDNFPVSTEVSLIEMLSVAGGVSADADLRRIKIIRNIPGSQTIEVDLLEMVEKGDFSTIPIVKPGDLIYVPRKHNVIQELSGFFRDAIFFLSLFRVFN